MNWNKGTLLFGRASTRSAKAITRSRARFSCSASCASSTFGESSELRVGAPGSNGSGLRLSPEQRTEREMKVACLDKLFAGRTRE